MTSTSEHQEAKRILAAWVPVTLAEQIRARAETERQSAATFAHEAARGDGAEQLSRLREGGSGDRKRAK